MHFAAQANQHPFHLEEKNPPERLIRSWGRQKELRLGKSEIGQSSIRPELTVTVPTQQTPKQETSELRLLK